jgi:hypothetical protein
MRVAGELVRRFEAENGEQARRLHAEYDVAFVEIHYNAAINEAADHGVPCLISKSSYLVMSTAKKSHA